MDGSIITIGVVLFHIVAYFILGIAWHQVYCKWVAVCHVLGMPCNASLKEVIDAIRKLQKENGQDV